MSSQVCTHPPLPKSDVMAKRKPHRYGRIDQKAHGKSKKKSCMPA